MPRKQNNTHMLNKVAAVKDTETALYNHFIGLRNTMRFIINSPFNALSFSHQVPEIYHNSVIVVGFYY